MIYKVKVIINFKINDNNRNLKAKYIVKIVIYFTFCSNIFKIIIRKKKMHKES